MSKNALFLGFLVSILFLFSFGCKHEYQKMVDRELASGERHDSIFLDIHLGMGKKEFFDHCWRMNKKGLIWQGDKNTSVQFKMELYGNNLTVYFYPDFYQNKIYQMPVTYSYLAWSPWNKQFWSDTLQKQLVTIYENTYGKGFVEVEHSKLGKAFVKVDGNRRISIYKKGDQEVRVVFTDLLVENKIGNKKKIMADKDLPVWIRGVEKN